MEQYETERIIDKTIQVVESRKFLESEALAEYVLVDRNLLDDLFDLLSREQKVIAGFHTPDKCLIGEDFQ